MAKEFKGKTVLVTGASAGIGFAAAQMFLEAGARVVGVARRKSRLDILKRKSRNFQGVVCDISSDIGPLKKFLKSESVDVLVNNAGLALGRSSIVDTPREDWEAMIDTNIKGLIAVTQVCLPGMLQARRGDIVNLSSVAGLQVYQNGSVYCASKFAVSALTDAWRIDLNGTGVRVIGIYPGMVETEFSLVRFRGDKKAAKKVYEGMVPLSAHDIAQNIFWAVSQPRHMTVGSMVIWPTDQASVGLVHRSSKKY